MSGGTTIAGKSFTAAPRPNAAPAARSRPRSNANKPANIAAMANTSQFWNAYSSTGTPSAQRQARRPNRRSSTTVIATQSAAEASAVTRRTPSGPGAITAATYIRKPDATGILDDPVDVWEPAGTHASVQVTRAGDRSARCARRDRRTRVGGAPRRRARGPWPPPSGLGSNGDDCCAARQQTRSPCGRSRSAHHGTASRQYRRAPPWNQSGAHLGRGGMESGRDVQSRSQRRPDRAAGGPSAIPAALPSPEREIVR